MTVFVSIDYSLRINLVYCTVNLPNRVSPPKNVAVLGDQVQFQCWSSADVTWFHNGHLVLYNNTITITTIPNKLYSLTINDVRYENVGNYTCLGKIGPAFFKSNAFLTIGRYMMCGSDTSINMQYIYNITIFNYFVDFMSYNLTSITS